MVLCGGAFANLPHQYDANVGLASRLSWACDAYDRVTAFTNAEQQVTRQQWNARGGLTMLTDPATHTVLSGHDPAGNQITLTNRRSKGWQFNFDAANRLTGTITPMGRSNALVFNNRGLLQAGTDPMGRTTTFGYDAKGRTTSRADQAATSTCGYDANGSLTSVVELGGTNAWVLDAYDRVSSYKDADGNLVQYKYDPNGNLANLVYPGGKTVSYVYDSLNRLTNVTDWANRKTTFAYDLANRVTSITRPNGTVRLINYDAAGETTNIVEKTLGNFPIAFFTLAWNNSGRVAWEFAGPLPHPYTPPYRSMGYNDDNQITTLNSTNTLVYDFDGNMTTGPLTNNALTTYAYDARNRLLGAGGLNYGYDPAGNRTSVTNGTNVVRFAVNPNAALPQTLIRTQPDGSQTFYVYGLGLLYEVNFTPGGTELNTRTYHYDYRGSTVALTDGNGLPTDRIEYSPYGLTTYRAGTTDTPFLYNGRYGVMTEPNGLLYMRARYYNPYLCRFINPDPAGFGGGLNWYCYADGNPVNQLDPLGLGAVGEGARLPSWLAGPACSYDLSAFSPDAQAAVQESFRRSASLAMQGLDFDPTIPQIPERSTSFFLLTFGGLFMGGLASVEATAAAEGTMAVSPYRMTTAGETFSHYGYADSAASFEGGLRPGGFATSVGDLSGAEAQSGLALPRPTAPPNAVYTVTPQPGTWVRVNPVTAPQFGQPGGLPEFQFPGGTGPGTVSPPRLIP
jgi:RHS repeat-associated protein